MANLNFQSAKLQVMTVEKKHGGVKNPVQKKPR
jgi:hypothetical protein